VSARFTPETGHALAIGGHEGRRGRGHSFDRVLVRGHPLAWLDYGRLPRFHPADLNGFISHPLRQRPEDFQWLRFRRPGVAARATISNAPAIPSATLHELCSPWDSPAKLLLGGKTGRPRTVVDIDKAARLTTEEGPTGPRFVKYRKSVVDRSYAAETKMV
jgi:hypothetical protein